MTPKTMFIPKLDLHEAEDIAVRVADMLLATSNNQKGRSGSDLRRAIGDLKARAGSYIGDNVIAQKLSDCFELARLKGATFNQFDEICRQLLAQDTVYLAGTMVNNACISFSLQQMSLVILTTEFTSRDDVEAYRQKVNAAFDPAEEVAADRMVQEVYIAGVKLHAAVTFHLYETARPLPQMLRYRFAMPRSTLIVSHRLYDTAARADQLRAENKVVHPAFAPREGRALAF